MKELEYWISLDQSELDVIDLALAAFLKIPITTIQLSDNESEMYDYYIEEMEKLQARFKELNKLKDSKVDFEEH